MKKTLYIIYLVIACLAVAMQLGFRNILFRRYGYDSIFVGCFPNFIAVVLLSLIFNLVKSGKKDSTPLKISLMGTAAMVFYEFVQPLIQGRTFDWLDIFASLVGGLFVYIVLSITDQIK
ncbi:MAG: hypothetical protein EOO43_20535 [Flavobacterium sp.]|nr:MAG: hypothetical protein EOO43_20535 [Flavobacterium sp.]